MTIHIRFVGFREKDEKSLKKRINNAVFLPEKWIVSFDFKEKVNNPNSKPCSYIEIRAPQNPKGKREATLIKKLFPECKREIIYMEFCESKNEQKSKNLKLST